MHLDKYALKKVFKQHRTFRLSIVLGRRKPRPNETMNVDLPAFFVNFNGTAEWYLLKGPTSKSYSEPWWEYLDNYCSVHPQTPLTTSGTAKDSLRQAVRDKKLRLAQPTSCVRSRSTPYPPRKRAPSTSKSFPFFFLVLLRTVACQAGLWLDTFCRSVSTIRSPHSSLLLHFEFKNRLHSLLF